MSIDGWRGEVGVLLDQPLLLTSELPLLYAEVTLLLRTGIYHRFSARLRTPKPIY